MIVVAPAPALVARSLALEWSSLGLGPGPMAMAMVVASPAAPRAARARPASHARSTARSHPWCGPPTTGEHSSTRADVQGLRPIVGDRVAGELPPRRRPQDRWRRATKTLSCYSRDLASRTGTLDGSQSNPPCRRNRFRAERQAARFYPAALFGSPL